MSQITDTFEATGTSDEIISDVIDIAIRHTGTASIDVERQMPSGNWIKIKTGITADYNETWNFGRGVYVTLRLNCTSYTDDAEFAMTAPEPWLPSDQIIYA
ncbi:hypothetical protein [Pseudohoeflea coraliihabitans]|uniref:Uncharacterized protein n=1 Tax=Pseudohoeflea coraliihabitans TaxID=2860393 RepID=A0ABS6WVW4_9HYPH|nr:hypothetical protein [Pseudohoeflea sp. DP4N28-3]MBW3099240.1 hypothetical protein [Pseudohoeflea sp. DP4N28-3]